MSGLLALYLKDLVGKPIDLTSSSLQDIGDGFLVGNLSLEEHLSGILVRGRIVNSTSLTHTSVTFKIVVARQSKEFTIQRIASASSSSFEIYLPNVPVAHSNSGRIEYLSSSVSYGQY
ncbi:hypothetical protein HUU42_04685 [bacterium]|nr:hypothetical protein [bacterium]